MVDGQAVVIHRDDVSLLAALRDELGVRGPKDGCSPQGQCGCCTVLVDGAARVACVTAVTRAAGRTVITSDGLDPAVAGPLVEAMSEAGASQCGFCTPGILCRLAALGPDPSSQAVDRALLAHLCRCTGWRGIIDAATATATAGAAGSADRRRPSHLDQEGAGRRASIEGRTPQRTGADVVAGRGGFADDSAPLDALVAVPDGQGGWAVGETVSEARSAAGKAQGRRSGHLPTWPVAVPEGRWDVTLQTTWVEPGYLEPDASWCLPGGQPASPVANGGAFGGKTESMAPAAARALADRHGRAVRVLYSREDVVRLGAKRPPLAAGVRADGTGTVRVARTPGVARVIAGYAPHLDVEELDVAGPLTSGRLRAAGWAEAAVLAAAVTAKAEGRVAVPAETGASGWASVESPEGATAGAHVALGEDGLPIGVRIDLACGEPLDEVVLHSYAIGATHMGLGWVLSEAIAVDDDGRPEDLTMRSWGILRARDTPPVDVRIDPAGGPPVNGSDAVFAAAAAATWIAQGLPPRWPTRRGAFR